MVDFLNNYGNNITVIVVVLGFVMTVIVQWEAISKQLSKVVQTLDRVPLFLFKLTIIAVSGLFIGSVYWIFVDFLFLGALPDVLSDIVSGAVWGIPAALLASRTKNVEIALLLSILMGVIILLLLTPEKIFPDQDVTKKLTL